MQNCLLHGHIDEYGLLQCCFVREVAMALFSFFYFISKCAVRSKQVYGLFYRKLRANEAEERTEKGVKYKCHTTKFY